MKKRFILTAAISFLVIINVSASEPNHDDSSGKKYTHLVKIDTRSGEYIVAALDSMSADSIFFTGLYDNLGSTMDARYKILNEKEKSGIARSQVRKFKIKRDTNIIYSDELESNHYKQKKNRFWKIAGGVGEILGEIILTSAQCLTF